MAGLAGYLQERLQTTVEVADPFRRVRVDGKVDRRLIEECGPSLAVAVGLATRRPGDK
jgi:Tfp pilus assembly PilM family ATPase